MSKLLIVVNKDFEVTVKVEDDDFKADVKEKVIEKLKSTISVFKDVELFTDKLG